MNSKLRWLGLAGFVALLAASAGCGKTVTITKAVCDGVTCNAGMECDPTDGICKCGGQGGIVCESWESCKLDNQMPVCFSAKCELVTCDNGESCDPQTGECSCGGVTCGADEQCVENVCVANDPCTAATCSPGLSCDPVDGRCKCGGEICSPDELCIEGLCTPSPCAGVHCSTNSYCDLEDGTCHCNGFAGPICDLGEACRNIDGTFMCDSTDLCAGVACGGGTSCDPADGLCHCFSAGVPPEMAPVCDPTQSCVDGRCVGGELCHGQCEDMPNYVTCDPDDGLCKCGGEGGDQCSEDELCTGDGCALLCEFLAEETGCPSDMGCFWEPTVGPDAFCAVSKGQAVGSECNKSSDCQEGLICTAGTSSSTNPGDPDDPQVIGHCKLPCHMSLGDGDCMSLDEPGYVCRDLLGDTAPPDIGLCIKIL